MDKSKWEIYFHNLLDTNWHMQTGGHMHAVRSGQQTQQNVAAGHIIKVVAAVMNYALCFLKMEFINQ